MKGLWLSQESHAPIHYPGNWLDFTEGIDTNPIRNLNTPLQLLTNHRRDPPETTGSCVEVERWPPQQSQRQLRAAIHILQMACALWDCSKVLENNESNKYLFLEVVMVTNPFFFFLTTFILEIFFFFFKSGFCRQSLSECTPGRGQGERAVLLSAWTMDARPP